MGRGKWISREAVSRGIAPVPLVEIADDRRVLIEHHQGVQSYTGDRIAVRVRYGQIRIAGSGLCIARMTKEQLVICGRIQGVDIVRSGGNNER